MENNLVKNYIYPIATLTGAIVGVGIFSLPFVTSRVGLGVMLGYFLSLGVLVTLVHLFFGELCQVTPDYKRLPGFAKFYLGNHAQKIALISTVLGSFGSILAYLIVGGEFLAGVFLPIFGGTILLYTLLYFAVGAILIYFGIRIIAQVNLWGLILFFLILSIIWFCSFPSFKTENIFLKIGEGRNLFLPYGPILFSLWGATMIPEIEEMLGENKRQLKKVIFLSIFISAIIYLFFIYLILGITGTETTESALTGLQNLVDKRIISLVLFFGVWTTFTSFIAVGLTVEKILRYDFKMEKSVSWALTCIVPLILFLMGIKRFIPIISFVGSVMLGIEGILILLMYQRIKKKIFLFLTIPLILIFIFGIIYEVIY